MSKFPDRNRGGQKKIFTLLSSEFNYPGMLKKTMDVQQIAEAELMCVPGKLGPLQNIEILFGLLNL